MPTFSHLLSVPLDSTIFSKFWAYLSSNFYQIAEVSPYLLPIRIVYQELLLFTKFMILWLSLFRIFQPVDIFIWDGLFLFEIR